MLAIIPARGGSKGVPKKNIKILGDKPLIQWTIDAAIKSKLIDRVILSTDDHEIAQTCKQFDIEIPFMRPGYLAKDDSLAVDNYLYTIERLKKEFGFKENEFIVLLPTSPFRSCDDIDEAIDVFYSQSADSIISCCEIEHPVEWALGLDSSGKIISNIAKIKNRQDYKKKYRANGAIYILKYSLLKTTKTYFNKNSVAYIMPPEKSIDIDTQIDFKFAEFLINTNAI